MTEQRAIERWPEVCDWLREPGALVQFRERDGWIVAVLWSPRLGRVQGEAPTMRGAYIQALGVLARTRPHLLT
jgi:hypothetical protein